LLLYSISSDQTDILYVFNVFPQLCLKISTISYKSYWQRLSTIANLIGYQFAQIIVTQML